MTDVWAEDSKRRGECDRCRCDAVRLYYVGVDDESSEDEGDWVFCGSCTRDILKRSDVLGRLVTS